MQHFHPCCLEVRYETTYLRHTHFLSKEIKRLTPFNNFLKYTLYISYNSCPHVLILRGRESRKPRENPLKHGEISTTTQLTTCAFLGGDYKYLAIFL